MKITVEQLTQLTGLYARLVQLTELRKKLNQSEKAELYLVREQLKDLGLDIA